MNPEESVDPEALCTDLVRFARGILERDAAGRLLDSPADLQTVMGELRRRLFAYEVRFAAPPSDEGWRPEGEDPSEDPLS